MPTIRANTAIDPSQIADMFNPLAKAFAPPTGQEILAGAKARETAQRVQMVQDLYDAAGRSDYNQAIQDRRAIAAGLYNPNQSFYSVDQGNATTLKTNAADNARALDQTRMQQAGESARNANTVRGSAVASLYGALSPGQVGPAVPAEVAGTVGLPALATRQGLPKPVTQDEVAAQALLAATPEQRRSVALKGVGNTEVQTPDGIRIVPSDQAVGMTPAPKAADPKYFNYDTPDGKTGTAMTGVGGKLVDTQTGAELPQGSKTYTAQLTGNKADTGLGASAKSATETRLLDLSNLEGSINALENIVNKNPGAIGTTGAVMGFGQDALATAKEAAGILGPQAQKYLKDVEQGGLPPEMSQYFNPNIPQAKLLENTILAQYAKMQDPGGRLSNQQMEIAAKALGSDGFLRSADKTRAVLAGIRQQIEQQRSMLGGVSPAAAAIRPGNAPTAPAVPVASARPAGQTVRRRYNPATGALE